MSELHKQKSAEHNTVAKITDTLRQQGSEQQSRDMVLCLEWKYDMIFNGHYNHTALARYSVVQLSRQQKSVLMRLRSGTLALAIETGRYL